MKRTLLLCLLILNGCQASPQAAIKQCQSIAQQYLNMANTMLATTTVADDETVIRLDFTVKSALGTQPGKASCHYRTTQITPLQPHRITLGNTVFTHTQDIQDLLNLRTEWPDLHHGH